MKIILSENELHYLFKDIETLQQFVNSISEGCRIIGSEVDMNLDSEYQERATKRLSFLDDLIKESKAYKNKTTFENVASMGTRDAMLKLARHEVETYILGSRGAGKRYYVDTDSIKSFRGGLTQAKAVSEAWDKALVERAKSILNYDYGEIKKEKE